MRAKVLSTSIQAFALKDVALYGVPRGGLHVMAAVVPYLNMPHRIVETPEDATILLDDLVDSGATMREYRKKNATAPFLTLIPKRPGDDTWYEFPWERMTCEVGPEENVRRVLEFIGEDPEREGLVETPGRVVRSWAELYSGYRQDPKAVLKVFADGACDEMVVLKDVEFFSSCEHHMLPFMGKAHIGYVPNGKVVGISKLARLLEVFTRRLQIQERIGQQVTEILQDVLQPKGCGCILEAKHLCMTCRGVGKQNSVMVTSSLRGVFLSELAARQEFFRLAGV